MKSETVRSVTVGLKTFSVGDKAGFTDGMHVDGGGTIKEIRRSEDGTHAVDLDILKRGVTEKITVDSSRLV